ncbi:MAG: hypothetical protein IJ190_13120 [Prevotella sp.]|nr:hypothetical protein [Prevotella sp.]
MSEEKKYPQLEEEEGGMSACEPVGVMTAPTNQRMVDDFDYSFGDKELGFPRTEEEVQAVIDEAESEWDNPARWCSSEELWTAVKQQFPWANI